MAIATTGPTDLYPSARVPQRSPSAAVGPVAPRSRRPIDLLAIAEGFATTALAVPELRGLTERSWILLAVTDLFEAWASGWPAGGTIELHDHGASHGAIVVASGSLTETTVTTGGHGPAGVATRTVATGDHRRFGSPTIHDLSNQGHGQAISVHVYSPRLTTMTYYRLGADGTVAPVRSDVLAPVGPFDTTADHDPS
jgi:hypothetical protein